MRIAARVKRHCSLPRLSLICGIFSFLGTVLASPLLLDDWAHVAGPAPPAVLAVPPSETGLPSAAMRLVIKSGGGK